MEVLVVLEHRFIRTPDGAVWTQTTFGPSFWHRYLEVFEGVKILARAQDVGSVGDGWQRVDGGGVTFIPVPFYIGPLQYFLRFRSVAKAARAAIKPWDAVICRVPSQIVATLFPVLRRTGHPYGVEVVGDPYDVFAPGSIKHPLRPFFRWWFSRELRKCCANACAAAYVTENVLQLRYPPNPNAFTTYYSSVELPPRAFVSAPRSHFSSSPTTLIFVGTLEQLYKGPDVLVEAVHRCIADGLDLRLIVVGDGRYRSWLQAKVSEYGIAEKVDFKGQVPAGSAVWDQLDRADLFVLPSYQEGLPRAMLEAMARALPCIGSSAGGIPELLDGEDMVPPGDAEALARKIREVVRDQNRMVAMSRRNLDRARKYEEGILRERRVRFYRYLREATQQWLNGRRIDTGQTRLPC